MSAITILGSARRGCRGPTRRETLKVGALSLLGGLFNTPDLLGLEAAKPRYLRPAKAKSVVLLYLQGGAPTQDMFDLKPHAPGGVGGEFRPIATSTSGVEVGELLPLSARWMHKSAVVRSVFHNGGCHKNLPNAKGGRDHWTYCYSALLAGAGVQCGTIYGASDEQAAFIKDKPVHIRDICATIYHLLGIDPEMPVYDRADRPVAIAHGGRAIQEILRG